MKIVIKSLALSFAFLANVYCGDEAHFVSDSITALNTDSFDNFIKDNEYSLVTFFAPWCGHCSALEPEYKALCSELVNSTPVVKCASVDATENMDLAQQHGVAGYPTIKLFNGPNSVQNYSGPRTKEGFTKWIQKLTGPSVKIVKSITEAEEFVKSYETAFIGQFTSKDASSFVLFESVANNNREHNYPFIAVLGSSEDKLLVYHTDEEQISLPFPKTIEDLEKTVKLLNIPLLAPISAENYSLYMARQGYTVWFCASPADYQKFNTIVREVASKFRENYSFVYLDTEQYGSQLSQHLLIEKFPGIVVQSVKVAAIRYLYNTNDFSSSAPIIEFMNSVEAGTHPLNIKSEEVPTEQTEAVQVVVGSTFEEIVFQKDKDVLLEIYASWCGHCKNLEPIYNQLAEGLKDNDKIVIAKINGPSNDIPYEGFSPKAFPTILFVRAGTRIPISYEGKRTVEAFKEFINEHASTPIDQSRDEL